MAQSSREHILSEIRRLAKENGGTPIGMERFEAVTGILGSSWSGRYWARWNDAVSEAGYEPNSWQSKTHDDDTLIRLLADMTRELGRFPTRPELQLARRVNTSQIPNAKVFSNRLGTKADQIEKVRAFEIAGQLRRCGDNLRLHGSSAPPKAGCGCPGSHRRRLPHPHGRVPQDRQEQ